MHPNWTNIEVHAKIVAGGNRVLLSIRLELAVERNLSTEYTEDQR
jgi:hypothetical protein